MHLRFHKIIETFMLAGKSFSEALIIASVNPQYDETLFIELQEKYKFRTCCEQILFWMLKQKTDILG